MYRAVQKPWYPTGHGIVLAYIFLGLISNGVYYFLIKKENAARAAGERDEVIGPLAEGEKKPNHYATLEDAKADKGDNWSGYKYVPSPLLYRKGLTRAQVHLVSNVIAWHLDSRTSTTFCCRRVECISIWCTVHLPQVTVAGSMIGTGKEQRARGE